MKETENSNVLEWWAYRHVNGTFHLKRFLDTFDIVEAHESLFVDQIYGPFIADNHKAAEIALKVIVRLSKIIHMRLSHSEWQPFTTAYTNQLLSSEDIAIFLKYWEKHFKGEDK